MKYMYHICSLTILSLNLLTAQPAREKHHAQFPLNCSECHTCAKPTYENPCLKLFPDFTREGITVHHSAEEAPEILNINVLSNIYKGSVFTHRLHAEMSEMTGGCISCHHFNPPGKIAPCRECHEATLLHKDLSKPGLKGAYHRQCMNCHRNWSHQTDCTVCHELKPSPVSKAKISDKARFIGKKHEKQKLSPPHKMLFTTDYEKGPLVTFFHDEHVRLFNIACVKCHQQESCGRCHDIMKPVVYRKDIKHKICDSCHEQEINHDCYKCHDTVEKKRFAHQQTGWPLNKFHRALNCTQCHDHKGDFIKPDKNCVSCHENWIMGSFNHTVTGLILDENHVDNDCLDCHKDNNFNDKPDCTDCHDDYSYPKFLPGNLVKKEYKRSAE